jgi:ADP-heptose:LPS heptosyltransferase
MLTPAVAALHAWRPDLCLAVVVEPPYVAILEGNPAVSDVIPFESFLSCAAGLRKRKFPVVFNQHGGPTSALLSAAIGAPVRVCWEHCQFPFAYSVRVPGAEQFYGPRKIHTVEHRLTQFYWTGLPRGPIPRPTVHPQPHAQAAVAGKLAECGVASGTGYAVVHAGAAYFTKRWSLDGFASVAAWLREEKGVTPVFVLGPGDGQIADAWLERIGAGEVFFDALSLRELIALLAGARLFLGNDSGPAHLATAAGCPNVVIFGSSDSALWRPWQAPHRIVQNDYACNPCRGDRCYAFAEPQCILSISVQQVRDACAQMLEERK